MDLKEIDDHGQRQRPDIPATEENEDDYADVSTGIHLCRTRTTIVMSAR
jgi:hypothetical protein